MRLINWLPGGSSLLVQRATQTARDVHERVRAPVRPVAMVAAPSVDDDGSDGVRTEVLEVCRVTARDVRLSLRWPEQLPMPEPGQFVIVGSHNGTRFVRRAYSICSDVARRGSVSIACREHQGGALSTKLVRGIVAGDRVEVSEPCGRFGLPLVEELAGEGDRPILLCAAGSGVTPIVSMLHALRLESSSRAIPRSIVVLLGYRSPSDALMFEEISQLIAELEGATLYCAFSRSDQNAADDLPIGVASLRSRRWCSQSIREALQGTGIDARVLAEALAFTCGPGGFVEIAEQAFEELGIARSFREEFYDQSTRKVERQAVGQSWSVTYRGFTSEDLTIEVSDANTILAAGRENGLEMEFSCSMGGCAACLVRVLSGDVSMLEPNCLTNEEQESGHILACVASPRGDVVVEPASQRRPQ